ncbi:MAG: hypothetical protein OXI23_10530 [Gemmatimonadota bacterium]|nr:hypothetical protein [Gemmatimonadota bacterium]
MIGEPIINKTNQICCAPVIFYLNVCVFLCGCFSSVIYASSTPADSMHFCLPLDQWNPDHIRPTAKRSANLNVGEPRTVRMIYFLPNDRPFRQEVIDSIKVTIRQIQTFYAEQMQARGYGNRTFRFETDTQGEPLVHRVDGQHPDNHYIDDTWGTMLNEIEQVFAVTENIYLVVIDNSINAIGVAGQHAEGIGIRWTKNSGLALVSNKFSWQVVVRQLGYAFGLQNDFRDSAYILSYAPGANRLSACNASFLAVHPHFNPDIQTSHSSRISPPGIQLISPQGYPEGSKSISVQLRVSVHADDPDRLHQVVMLVRTIDSHRAAESYEVKACRRMDGEEFTIVEFDYDGIIPSNSSTSLSAPILHEIVIKVIDTGGDIGTGVFKLREVSIGQHSTTLRHTEFVHSVAFSLNGTTLASGVEDGKIALWDITTQRNIATLEGYTGPVYSVTFSPDRTIIASGAYDRMVKLWDVATQRNLVTFEGHTDAVTSVAFSPDGTSLASGGADQKIRLWSIAAQANIATLEGHTSAINTVAFSPDGRNLASGSAGGAVLLWYVREFTHPRPHILVKISGDGQEGAPGEELNPLVIEVRDQHGSALQGAQVTFAVTAGDVRFNGQYTVVNATTDANGRAESLLTLGNHIGQNTVEVTVGDIEQKVTFNAVVKVSVDVGIADFDRDGTIGFADFLLFVGQFGLRQGSVGYDAQYDLDDDGAIGFGDFLIFASVFGKSVSSN